METIGGGLMDNKKTFLGHIFSNTEESKAEFLNVMQYALLGIIPIILLNKTVQKFIPDVDLEKSSLEILAEIILQILIMFFGIIIIHRFITFFPTYSGFKFDYISFTSFILPFFIIVFSFHSKISAKINILLDRTYSFSYGEPDKSKVNVKKFYSENTTNHSPSQADFINSSNNDILHNPISSNNSNNDYFGPIAANSILPNNFFN